MVPRREDSFTLHFSTVEVRCSIASNGWLPAKRSFSDDRVDMCNFHPSSDVLNPQAKKSPPPENHMASRGCIRRSTRRWLLSPWPGRHISLMAARSPKDCLVVVGIGSRRLTATVAWMQSGGAERIVASRSLPCRWVELDYSGQLQALSEVLGMASESAGVMPYSVFVSMSDTSLRANWASAFVDLGHPMLLTREDRDLALLRACKQAIGTNRTDLHALQPLWEVRGEDGNYEVENPIGQRGSQLRCGVMLVTAERDVYDAMDAMLAELDLTLEGMIAPPVGLYRAVSGQLPRRGSTVLLDFGARHTSLMVHRKGRLIHLETNRFGGDDLTEAVAESLKISSERAEALKRQVDLSVHGGGEERDFGQTYLWREVQENSRHLGPAAMVCASLLRQFLRDRCNYLKDHEFLSHTGRVHCFGRAAALGGLTGLVKEIFAMETVLGTKQADRDPANEIASAMTVGLVRAAADERRRQIAQRDASSSFRQVASAAGGIFSWLATPLT
ncbi:MAG: hypothetical protein EA402_09230 [Planctomycetota bacterium]|nr:MAG: hypothetical protein EA402_09230 [Planctomycetota bacterium]